jgi:hypothetical protein
LVCILCCEQGRDFGREEKRRKSRKEQKKLKREKRERERRIMGEGDAREEKKAMGGDGVADVVD